MDKTADLFGKLNSLGIENRLTGTITHKVEDVSLKEFEKLCDELGDFYERVNYTFEVAENLNIKLIMD